MRLTFAVTYADGSTAEAIASVADQVAFEREFSKSLVELASAPRVSDMCWLAWHGLRRANGSTPQFDEWLLTVDNVEMADASDPVPLGTAASTGS